MLDPEGRTYAHPRGQTKGWDEVDTDRLSVPSSALRLGDGYAISENQLVSPDGTSVSLSTAYTTAKPIKTLFDSVNNDDYSDDGNRNYSYDALREPKWSLAVAQTARELGVPGKWIADVTAVLTHGTFQNLGNVTPFQAYSEGLENPDVRGPGGQMGVLKKAVSRHKASDYQDGPEWLISAALLKPAEFQKVKAEPKLAKTLGSGFRKLSDVWDLLGSHVGGAYDHILNKERKVRWSHVHDQFSNSCAVCHALKYSHSDIVPHQYQEAVKVS